MKPNQTNQNKQVVAVSSSGLPAYLSNKVEDLGVDVMGTGDVITPRIKIAQPMSKAKETMEDLRDGQYYATPLMSNLGDRIEFYILTKYNSKIWYSDKQTIIGYWSENPKTKVVVQFGDEIDRIVASKEMFEKGTDCFNYIIVLAEDLKACMLTGMRPTMYIYTAQSAARGPAKRLNSLIMAQAQRGVPIYASKIIGTTKKEQFDRGTAYMPEFTLGGYATEEEYIALEGGYKLARIEQDKGILHEEGEQPEPKMNKFETPKEDDPFSV